MAALLLPGPVGAVPVIAVVKLKQPQRPAGLTKPLKIGHFAVAMVAMVAGFETDRHPPRKGAA